MFSQSLIQTGCPTDNVGKFPSMHSSQMAAATVILPIFLVLTIGTLIFEHFTKTQCGKKKGESSEGKIICY